MRFRNSAIVLASLAVMAVGAGTAQAGTGPAPHGPSKRPTAQSHRPTPEGNPASARAQESGVCDDAYQIGSTTYIGGEENPFASVKQFYSPTCRKNYGYLWVWQSFRDTHDPYDIRIGVYDYATDRVHGELVVNYTDQQEFWSQGTDTVRDCTSAEGWLSEWTEGTYSVQTEKRC